MTARVALFAAALMLGAVGVNLGTRFLASQEAPIEDEWKQAILEARSEDTIKLVVLNDIRPLPGTAGYGTVLRSLRTPFMDEWSAKREEAHRDRDRLWAEMGSMAIPILGSAKNRSSSKVTSGVARRMLT